MNRSILVPLDGSPLAELALPTAARLASRTGAHVTLATVRPGKTGFGDAATDRARIDADNLEECQEYLDSVARVIATGTFAVDTTVLEGLPADAISRYASRVGVELVVMTTHGRTGLGRALAGSVADEMVRESRIPILLCAARAHRSPSQSCFERILVPLDGSTAGETILPYVGNFAALCGARCILVRTARSRQRTDAPREYLLDAADRLQASHVDVDVSVEVLIGHMSAARILQTVMQRGADLVAMTTPSERSAWSVVGSLADRVMHVAMIPLLLVRQSAH